MNNQKQIGSKEIKQKYKLISKYAIAQYEFEKIVGFKEAIRLTIQEKEKIGGTKCLSEFTNSNLENLLLKLRYLYRHLKEK